MSNLKKILVVDDEQSIVTLLEFNLQKAGFDVIKAMDGITAVQLAETENPDLLVLDIMLPGLDGMEVCKKLRMEKINTPILMLTAKDEEFDKILGLELGADDYMTKPFSPREVVARIKAILRRSGQQPEKEQEANNENVIAIGKLKIFPEKYEVYFDRDRLELTPKEFELLYYMATHPGRVMTRDQLLNAVWNYDFVGDSRIVDVHISHLREKIEEDTKQPTYIKTVRGLGYKLEG
ncbi:response regulator transcription factor [Aneurinibacillus sp. Ricciae_BoGa-3]|uniref:response regulator transcription factor n=1 Tax=Aneurinibacillus sp. Ricciae_BoGa-3 TaxID=3022697 RepID=UPI002342684B|nr:response regulator transcription factor [Aneurinibacillus sp. Ricciae_BoGa-3]WCK56743.1 response regulator transcription factor [Aneurinibacillus sp. Ricciae_BoGa-3]